MQVLIAWLRVSDRDQQRVKDAIFHAFGANAIPKDEQAHDTARSAAALFVLGSGDPEAQSEAEPSPEEEARVLYEQAQAMGLPVLGGLGENAHAPSKTDLPSDLGGLAFAPWIDLATSTEELIAVLRALDPLAEEEKPVASPHGRRSEARELTRVSTEHRRDLPRRLRRDPILMRIATTSGGLGLLLYATLGFGPASLFLFLSAVSFSISRIPDADDDPPR